MTECVICYEKFTDNNCNCLMCTKFDDKDTPIITDKILIEHNKKKRNV